MTLLTITALSPTTFAPAALMFALSLMIAPPSSAQNHVRVDDFSDPQKTAAGAARMVFTDRDVGGRSEATLSFADGVLTVKGQLAPARGMPGYVSLPLLLTPEAQPVDVSQFKGVRLRVKIHQGTLSVQASSPQVENFDYHTSAPLTRRAEFQEVKIPFQDLKRGWSEQTPLNLKTLTSINLVSFALVAESFAYEVDEVGFY